MGDKRRRKILHDGDGSLRDYTRERPANSLHGKGMIKPEPPSRHRAMARRTFLGLGGVAALSLLVGTRLAWGGVGGGAWGSYGSTAYPGSHFGFDAGWAYSYNRCVWLSASCDCTVGRMTELFLEVRVDAYVACNGIWSPTWSPDIPDTPTYAYIRNEEGAWLTSAYWIIDTTYDHDYYAYMTGAALRVSRQVWDWTCWCGADIKGLGGSAPGTHSVAEAPQIVPRHMLVDNRAWQRKIVTLRPQAAEHLYMDALGGGIGAGTNVGGWSSINTTNQNWIVLTSTQGRSCFVPVHTGSAPLFLDVAGGVWDDGANIQLWTGNGGLSQSFWLHDLGGSYHLIVPECSGCAIDLEGGAQTDGSNIAQWNCYGNWANANQHWKLEEVLFRKRDEIDLVVSGEPEAGGVLAPGNPETACLPRNYPGTSGMVYRYAWYRGVEEGSRSELVQVAREEPSYAVSEADEGSYLTCIVTAHTRFGDVPYRGEVIMPSVQIKPSKVEVRFFVDGEAKPCYQLQIRRGESFAVPPEVQGAAAKSDCAGVDGWYLDAACTVLFVDGTVVEVATDLFACNRVILTYAMASSSCVHASDRSFYSDPDLAVPLTDPASLLPPSSAHRFGERVVFVGGASVWYEDMGRVREAACAAGAYADLSAAGPLMRFARITCNTIVYLTWKTPSYDGIALS